MPKNTVLRVGPQGSLTEFDLGDEPASQAKILARSLLDTPEVIAYIHRPTGCVTVIGGKNRARHLPNIHAGIALQELSGDFHDAMGPLVITGYLHTGDLTALPDDAAAVIRDVCAADVS
ncbi:hypothetical protein [Streptomyces abikoensis]